MDNILILDYSSYERLKIRNILENIGTFDIIETPDVSQFKLLNLDLENLRLIIMDLAFPSEQEGFEVLKSLKSNKFTADVPVIIVTRSDQIVYRSALLNFDVNDYINKPYQLRRLEDSIKNSLSEKECFHFNTSSISNLNMTFDDYIIREIKCSRRAQRDLSIIFLTPSIIRKDYLIQNESTSIDEIFSIINQRVRIYIRSTDTVFISNLNEIIIVLPFTDEKGVKKVCDKIKAGIFHEIKEIGAKFNRYICPVSVTFPNEGENFQKLMECAFKKLIDMELTISKKTPSYQNTYRS